MNAFIALLRHELVLLFRQNVIGVAIATVALYAAALYFVPSRYYDVWLPAVLMSEIVSMGVLFIAAVMFIEIRQQTALAFAVTPVSTGVWIAAKVVAFTLLATASAQVLLLLTGRFPDSVLATAAVILSALLYNQIGLALALWTGNIRDFFLPFSAVMGLLALSIYGHLGVVSSALFWLVPTYPAMLLLASPVDPLPASHLAFALLLLLLWNAAAYCLCRRVFYLQVSARLGRSK